MASIERDAHLVTSRFRMLAVFVISIAVFEYGNIFLELNKQAIHWWGNLWWTGFSLAATVMCYETMRSQAPPARHAWRLFSAGCLSWFLGMLIWDYMELVERVITPFPAPSDLGFIALAPFFMAGFIAYQARAPSLSLLIKHLSDLGLIFCALVISLLIVLADSLTKLDVPWLYMFTALAYPPLYIGAFFLGLAYLLLYIRGPQFFPMLLLVIGIGIHAVADTLYAYALLVKTYEVGDYFDVFWLIGFGFILWGAREQRNIGPALEGTRAIVHKAVEDERAIQQERRSSALDSWIAGGALILVGIVAFVFWDSLYLIHPYILLPFACGLIVFLVLKEWATYHIASRLYEAAFRSDERVRLLLNSTVEAVYGIGLDGKCTFANRSFLNLLGYADLNEVTGKNIHELIHHTTAEGENYPVQMCPLRRTQEDGSTVHLDDDVIWRKDGSSMSIECWSHPVYQNGRLLGAVVTFMDITQRRNTDSQMRKLSRALEQSADAVTITNQGGVIEYVNAGFEAITGYTRDEVIGQTPNILKSGKMDRVFYRNMWRDINAGKVYFDVFINRRKDGTLYYEQKTITPLKDGAGTITHFISTGKDISERMQHQEHMQYLVQHDILTSLPNRLLFMDHLGQAMVRARTHDNKLAVVTLDIDRFKIINDTLGHDYGDRLLITIAARVKTCLRDGATMARLGGDEFGIIIDDIETEENILSFIRRIHDAMEQPYVIDNRELFMTVSVGISIYPDDGHDPQTILKNADAAMYRAKELGRNTFQFYAVEMGTLAFERLNLESSLRRALQRQEFQLAYQPLVSMKDGKVFGAEALLRWRHPDLGIVPPAEFVPLLEDSGLIVQVGQWVLQEACSQMKRWHDENYGPLRIAVNLSSVQFGHGDLVAIVAEVLQKTGLRPELLELEITESLLVKHDSGTQVMLEALSGMGVRLSIDDFGTGYSSLSYLKRFPIDTLKIDRSFIRDITTDTDDAAIVQAIIAMARALDLEIIAEGVETDQQLAFVKEHLCHGMQGYLFSLPVFADEFPAVLLRQLSVVKHPHPSYAEAPK